MKVVLKDNYTKIEIEDITDQWKLYTEDMIIFQGLNDFIYDEQLKLNKSIIGDYWPNKKDHTEKMLPINWKLALNAEAMEFIDCFNWKHWKPNDMSLKSYNKDYLNSIIELCDIVHFCISMDIEEGRKSNYTLIPYVTEITSIIKKITDDVSEYRQLRNLSDTLLEIANMSVNPSQEHINKAIAIITLCQIAQREKDKITIEDVLYSLSNLYDLMTCIYLGKLCLNKLRNQGHGRKYSKWEDNAIVAVVANSLPTTELIGNAYDVYREMEWRIKKSL